MIDDVDETPDLPPRIEFTAECPRCHFKHAKGKACPRCSDTLDLDTGWKNAYIAKERRKKPIKLAILLAVLKGLFWKLEGGV